MGIGRLWGGGSVERVRCSVGEGGQGGCCVVPRTQPEPPTVPSPRPRCFRPFHHVCPVWGPPAPGQRWPPPPSPWGRGVWTGHLVRPQLCPSCWTCPSLPASLLSPRRERVGEGLMPAPGRGTCSHWLRPREVVEGRELSGGPCAVAGAGRVSACCGGPVPCLPVPLRPRGKVSRASLQGGSASRATALGEGGTEWGIAAGP